MASNPQRIAEAAQILLAARADGAGPPDFPESCRPRTRAEAYAIQAAVAPALGPIGGWKVGRGSPEAEPACSALPLSGILAAPAVVPGRLSYRGIEAEISFRIGRSLPPRAEPYARADILAAIATCQAAVEIVETRFAAIDGVGEFSALADLQNHHALVVGAPNPAWPGIALERLTVTVDVDGTQLVERTGGNPGGDALELLLWLANAGSVWAGGLKAGEVVTTGSWIGKHPVAEGASVTAAFTGFPSVEAHLP